MMPSTTLEEKPKEVKPKEARKLAPSEMSADPTIIRSPEQIPPAGGQYVGVSPEGRVAVYCGTIPGDVDALPAAKELLATSPDTGGLSNADYVYKQLSALYGGNAQLPSFQSPSNGNVESVVFVSGSNKGGYGALHVSGTQAEFDRIVVDSLNVAGTYSAGSSLGSGMAQVTDPIPHLLPIYRGPGELHGVLRADDPRLKTAEPKDLKAALKTTNQNTLALKAAIENRNPSMTPPRHPSGKSHIALKSDVPNEDRLVHANQDILALLAAAAQARGSRQYLSTALFAAELVESFQMLTRTADPGKTDGEAVSRVLAFKLTPELALVPGFNSDIIQEWWAHGHRDYVKANTENDLSNDGNASGMLFLEFITDYLGVPVDKLLQHMPTTSGAALAKTYENLVNDDPNLARVAGKDGASAFKTMADLLEKYTQNADLTLSLPADGNPFRDMPDAKQGGLFENRASDTGTLAQDVHTTLGLEIQLDQQLSALKSTLQQLQSDLSGQPASPPAIAQANLAAGVTAKVASSHYKPNLPSSLYERLVQEATPYRAPQYDQSLQQKFWPHVYNELPNTGPHTDRLEVITGTNQTPLAVQVTGTITDLNDTEKDGDCHIYLQPDDPKFPLNTGTGQSPLEMEIIYTHHATQPDAQKAEQNYTNPFDITQLGRGTRILAAGPLIFDRVHGSPAPDGMSIETGLEIHPLAGITVLSGEQQVPPTTTQQPEATGGQVSTDLESALGQLGTLNQTIEKMKALIEKIKEEVQPAQG